MLYLFLILFFIESLATELNVPQSSEKWIADAF